MRLQLDHEQKKLLYMILYAKELEGVYNFISEGFGGRTHNREASHLEARAYGYDVVLWEALEKLTGETIDTLLEEGVIEEATKEAEALAQTYEEKRIRGQM